MSSKKNPSRGTGTWKTVTTGHHRLRSYTLNHVKGDTQDRNLGTHTGIMEVENPIIPKGLSGIEDTGVKVSLSRLCGQWS
jgi:hypothetical protein